MNVAPPSPAHAAPCQDAADDAVPAGFKAAMRRVAASVTLVTTRDAQGQPHGMAVSAVIPVSMAPASMLVAINHGASLHPVLMASRRFCVNLLGETQHALLTPFSQSALRAQRFQGDDWRHTGDAPPWLSSAPAAVFCEVELATDYGTHTLFLGRVSRVLLADDTPDGAMPPLVWLDGRTAALAAPDLQTLRRRAA